MTPSIEEIKIQDNNTDNRKLTVECKPSVLLWQDNEGLLQGQSVFLLVGDRELSPDTETLSSTPNDRTDTLMFDVSNIRAGQYYVLLRVDGIDSSFIDNSVNPPIFNSKHQVTI